MGRANRWSRGMGPMNRRSLTSHPPIHAHSQAIRCARIPRSRYRHPISPTGPNCNHKPVFRREMMTSDDALVVPAWCDPDRRRVRWSWDKCWIGLLYVDHESLAYATTDAVMISASLQDVTVEWRGGSAVTTHRFDLHVPGHSYRFYLSRPSATAPAFNPKLVDQIGDGLSTAGSIGQLASAVGVFSKAIGSIGDASGVIGNLLQIPGTIADQRRGRRNAEALRAHLRLVEAALLP
jgi:hypothetical protein